MLYEVITDFSFSFETAPNAPDEENTVKGYINFSSFLNEFSPDEDIKLPIDYDMYRDYRDKADTFEISTEVFSYTDIDTFITALEKNAQTPTWARYFASTHQPDTTVITSYSIHYTKLYEDGGGDSPHLGARRL